MIGEPVIDSQVDPTGGELIATGIKIRVDMDKIAETGGPEIPTPLLHGRKHRRILGRFAVGLVFQINRGSGTTRAPGIVADILEPTFQAQPLDVGCRKT